MTTKFTNTYKSSVVEDGLKVRKVLEGRDWHNADSFTVALVHGEVDGDEDEASFDPCKKENVEHEHSHVSHESMIVFNYADATDNTAVKNLGKVTFHKPGTYFFHMWEEIPTSTDKMIYDDTQYIAEMKVVPDGTRNLKVAEKKYWRSTKGKASKWPTEFVEITDEQNKNGTITFTNRTTGNLAIAKTLSGGTDTSVDFEYSLQLTNGTRKGVSTFESPESAEVSLMQRKSDGTNIVVNSKYKLNFDADGIAKFKLKRGQYFVLYGILGGTDYVVVETDAKGRIASSVIEINDVVVSTGVDTISGSIIGGQREDVLYTNTDKPDTPSGGGGGGGGGSTPKTPEPQKPTDPKGPMKTIQELGGIGGGGNPLSRWLSVLGANEEDPFNLMVLAMTGDQGKAGLLALICLAALGGLGILFFGKKRKKKN